jgi:hypothetical protein
MNGRRVREVPFGISNWIVSKKSRKDENFFLTDTE